MGVDGLLEEKEKWKTTGFYIVYGHFTWVVTTLELSSVRDIEFSLKFIGYGSTVHFPILKLRLPPLNSSNIVFITIKSTGEMER